MNVALAVEPFDEGIALAREAVDLLSATDAIVLRVDALVDLAEVLDRAHLSDETRSTLEEAHGLCALKQMQVPGSRVEALMERSDAAARAV